MTVPMRLKGAAVLDERYLFLYMEKDEEALRRALPLSYDPCKGSFLTALFVDGCDHLGQMTGDQVRAALATMCPLEESPMRERYAGFATYQLNGEAVAPSAASEIVSMCCREARKHGVQLAALAALALLLAMAMAYWST